MTEGHILRLVAEQCIIKSITDEVHISRNGDVCMATKSFITDFSINKNNAGKITKALQKSKQVEVKMDKRVVDHDRIEAVGTVKNPVRFGW